jgi:hypothetical protein
MCSVDSVLPERRLGGTGLGALCKARARSRSPPARPAHTSDINY